MPRPFSFSSPFDRRRPSPACIALVLSLWLAWGSVACAPPPEPSHETVATERKTVTALITADGETRQVTTAATTVRDILAEAGVSLNAADEIEPPADSFLPENPSTPLSITVVRVSETTEVIPESIPFARRIVRNAELSPTDPPRIVQVGVPGLREVTVRIVYRDGLEAERWPTASTIIEPAIDEIVMVGVGSSRDAVTLSGKLAYLNEGRAILLEGTTESPRQLPTEGALDGRVFQLSPDGRYLLYSASTADDEQFSFRNELWIAPTEGNIPAQPLRIENVLWAEWDPVAIDPPRFAYTTARSTTLPPGWEANNDLWLMSLPAGDGAFAPVRLIETYPAAYSWWGGNYAWSPDGQSIAFAFADQVGLLTMPAAGAITGAEDLTALPEPQRTVLRTFAAYDTGADWAWIPPLSWSADGLYLSFVEPLASEPERFDLLRADVTTNEVLTLAERVGMWAATQWSPPARLPDSLLASFRAAEPDGGDDSGYILWLSDAGGQDGRRFFPPEGESGSLNPAATPGSQSLAWGPDGSMLAFLFDGALHLLDLASGEVFQPAQDDTTSRNLTWSPYGAGNGGPDSP